MDGAALAFLIVTALSGVALITSHKVCYIESAFHHTSNNRHCWVLLFNDPCKCTAIRLGGMTTSYNRERAPCLDYFFLSEDPVEVRAFFNCEDEGCFDPEPLGLEDGSIPDSRIKVSSELGVGRGRLNGDIWWPRYLRSIWIEVDIGVSTVVSGVITQGGVNYRVTRYRVRYKKLPFSDFYDVIHRNGSIKVFEGNIQDARTPVTNMFDQSIVATIVRIMPVAYEIGVGLRLELLGCQIKVK